jgi:predicted PurR-regulated permease PerM
MGRKIVAILITLLFGYIFLPLMTPAAMGAVLGTLLYPLLSKLEKVKIPEGVSAFILTVLVTVIVILPSAFLIFIGAKAGLGEVQKIKAAASVTATAGAPSGIDALINSPRVQTILDHITQWVPVPRSQILSAVQDLAGSIGLKIADLLGQLVTHLPSMAFGLIIMILTIFFVLTDGPRLLNMIRRFSMFSLAETEEFLQMMGVMCRSVVLASLISGLAQSFIMLIGCWVTGLEEPLLIAFVIFVSSFIPILGSAPITFGLMIHQFLIGNTTNGIILAIFAVVVGLIDNLVRPLFIRGSSNLHPLLALFAALGGIQVLGFLGVFLGPIVAAMFVLIMKILMSDREADPSKA